MAEIPREDRVRYYSCAEVDVLRAEAFEAGREAAAADIEAKAKSVGLAEGGFWWAARIARGDNQEERVCTCGNCDGFYGTAGELPRTRQSVPERDPECPFHGRDQQ